MKNFGIIHYAPGLTALKSWVALLKYMIEFDFDERQSVESAFYVISAYLEKLPKAYILSYAADAFAISEEELLKMKDIYDGSHVSFEAPNNQYQKERWAKNIELYKEGDRRSIARELWELKNKCRLLRLKVYASDDKS